MNINERELVMNIESNNKYRTSSAILCLNKDYIKSARRLRKIAEGTEEATDSEIRALEAIINILLPLDPILRKRPEVLNTSLTMACQQGSQV